MIMKTVNLTWKAMILWILIFQPLFFAYGQTTLPVTSDKSVSQQANDIELLKAEVKRLAAENAKLKEENQQLRKMLTKQDLFEPGLPPSVSQTQDKPSSLVQTPTSSDQQETGYWMTTSSGKRHNKNCRYYKNSKGRFCKPDEGIACKICGG